MIEQDLKTTILRYLSLYAHGARNAKTGKVIAQEFNTEWRTVASAIRQLRIDGVLIGSSKGNNRLGSLSQNRAGYYIPETEQEVDNYLKAFKDELFDMLKTYNHQKKAKQRRADNLATTDLFYKTAPSGQRELAFA